MNNKEIQIQIYKLFVGMETNEALKILEEVQKAIQKFSIVQDKF